MRVCDYIADRLAFYGVKRVYGIMGGGAATLNDGFIKNPDIDYICFHHEQGASNAALAESKLKNDITVVNPTTGCGSANCITSLISAYQDSIPLIFISGNYRLNQTTNFLNRNLNIKLRKIGLQEHDIISHVKGATKHSCFITEANQVPYELEKMIHLSMEGRKGPCWLDIPSDIQNQIVDLDLCAKYIPEINSDNHIINNIEIFKTILKKSHKPLILAGYGIHLSNSQSKFRSYIDKHSIPFVSTFLAKDIIEYNHPLNIGTIGIKGSRSGNYVIQKCDLLLILGSSLNVSHIGYDENLFSPNSKKVLVNIDKNDYLKNNVKIDLYFEKDIGDFLNNVL